MALALPASVFSELEYGHRVLPKCMRPLVLEINNMLNSDLVGERGSGTTTGLWHLCRFLGSALCSFCY